MSATVWLAHPTDAAATITWWREFSSSHAAMTIDDVNAELAKRQVEFEAKVSSWARELQAKLLEGRHSSAAPVDLIQPRT
jgi:hypothetical protein